MPRKLSGAICSQNPPQNAFESLIVEHAFPLAEKFLAASYSAIPMIMPISKKMLEILRARREEKLRAAVVSIQRSTIQLFMLDDNGDATPTGSGVLISYCDKYFVLTASHVIAQSPHHIWIHTPNGGENLQGQLCSTNDGSRHASTLDPFDFAFVVLDEAIVKSISVTHDFVSLADIDLSHTIVQSRSYASIGFPASKTKQKWNTDKLVAKPFQYWTEADSSFDLKSIGGSSNTHLAMKFDGKVTSARVPLPHAAPSLKGISGCGLWFLPELLNPKAAAACKLVGLVTGGGRPKANSALIAVRIELVVHHIYKKVCQPL